MKRNMYANTFCCSAASDESLTQSGTCTGSGRVDTGRSAIVRINITCWT